MARKRRPITIIDGYNVINAWPELKEIAKTSLAQARDKLIDAMAEYKSLSGEDLIIVFDAYNLDRNVESYDEKYGISIVYTKRFQTADTYIERQILRLAVKNQLKVVSDDGQIQVLAASKGASRITAAELKMDLYNANKKIRRVQRTDFNRNFKSFPLSEEMIQKIESIKEDLDK